MSCDLAVTLKSRESCGNRALAESELSGLFVLKSLMKTAVLYRLLVQKGPRPPLIVEGVVVGHHE